MTKTKNETTMAGAWEQIVFETAGSGIKSRKHREKLEKLLRIPDEKIKKIGPCRVCFDKEFLIGNGCKGTCVYVGFLDDGTEVAVKRMLKQACGELDLNEASVLRQLAEVEKSQHIVSYRHFSDKDDRNFSYLVLDLCEETLKEYVEARSKEDLQKHGPVVIRGILTGLKSLHCRKKKILHRDLKPQNILFDLEGCVRLADFGLSRVLDEDITTHQTKESGTRNWMAVESLRQPEKEIVLCKRKSDIQVAGMISFYILTKGGHPFGSSQDCAANIMKGKPVNLEHLTDSQARDFVSKMISHNSEDRPYVEEALDHPYLQQPALHVLYMPLSSNLTRTKIVYTVINEVLKMVSPGQQTSFHSSWTIFLQQIAADCYNPHWGYYNYER